MAITKLNEVVGSHDHSVSPPISDMAPELAALSAFTPALMPRRSEAASAPLSYAQERLWFLEQINFGDVSANISRAIRVKGDLKPDLVKQSLQKVVNRHESLRTTFATTQLDAGIDSKPVQLAAEYRAVVVPVIDLGTDPPVQREVKVRDLARAEAQRPFDLTLGPLFRATLFRLDAGDHVLLLNLHRIVCDERSSEILLRDLWEYYGATVTGEDPLLPQLPVQCADFAAWQRETADSEPFQVHCDYWKERLYGAPAAIELPTAGPRPAIQSWRGASVSFEIPKALSRTLRDISRDHDVTLFVTLTAALQVLISRYSGQQDIVIGTTFHNRVLPETKDLIGPLSNAVALRTDLSGNPTFRELLARVKESTLSARGHSLMPFEKLVEELQLERSLSHAPVFQIAINLKETVDARLPIAGLVVAGFEFETGIAGLDLTLEILDAGDQLTCNFEYASDLFDRQTIKRIAEHFGKLLTEITRNPEQRIGELTLLSQKELNQILQEWNNTATAEYFSQNFCQLFESQVEQTPDAVAVEFGETLLTYAELNQKANKLAHYLQERGIGPEVLTGVFFDRSPDMVIGLLGTLKAGGAYLPLDISYPAERLAFMLNDAAVLVLLTQEDLLPLLPKCETEVICLDRDDRHLARQSDCNPSNKITGENLAYVIYTSGSTGKPKGVQVSHSALSNFLRSMRERPGISTPDVLLSVTTLSFDIAGLEIYLPLTLGARLAIARREDAVDGVALAALMNNCGATVMQATPATWRLLIEAGWQGDEKLKILCGGEALSRDLAKQLLERGAELWNLYGPTETTIWSAVDHVSPPIGEIAVGKPIANTQIYILDSQLQPVPIAVAGELYIGGDGLARGYLRRPELTAEKFIPNPFSGTPGKRLYRTGDLARFSEHGTIEVLGRLDHQVKVRGYRIELGEIEAVLNSHSMVSQSVVTATPDTSGEQRLTGYFVPDQQVLLGPGGSEWRNDQLAQWRSVWDETYEQPQLGSDPAFNLNGWKDSYTELPIPAEQMREWLDQTLAHVLNLQPRRVMEIGCGTGLLVFGIAPHCSSYIGTDFSATVLRKVQDRLDQDPRLSHVTLLKRPADDFTDISPNSLDCVVINSVIQYFPTLGYLSSVIEKAVQAVESGGFIFIGDVRHFSLLELFHTSVLLHQAEDKVPSSELVQGVRRRVDQEEELLIDPSFFLDLSERIPGISRVVIQLKEGQYQNELTKFRYDVILQVGSGANSRTKPRTLDGRAGRISLALLKQFLVKNSPEELLVTRIPNARLSAEARQLRLLTDSSGGRTAGEIRTMFGQTKFDRGIDPDEVKTLARELTYDAAISFTPFDRTGAFDVSLVRGTDGSSRAKTLAAVDESRHISDAKPRPQYANNPLAGKLYSFLRGELRDHLKARLPDYMIPQNLVLLDALPLTPNGKLDRRLLPKPDTLRRDGQATYVVPRDNLEKQLASIWEAVLGVRPVGSKDNFFELGGHSLLAVRLFAQIENRLGKHIPLATLFQAPTVEQLSNVLREIEAPEAWSSLVAIQTEGSKPPLFCVHAAGANVLIYRPLSRHLGKDQPIYALQAQGLDGQTKPYARVEDMAVHYIREMRAFQPEGPYHLLGASFGGLVAYEMAYQLTQQGQQVGFVSMLNTGCPVYTLRKRITSHVVHLLQNGPRVYGRAVIRGLARRINKYVSIGDILSDESENIAAPDPELQQVLESRYSRDEALIRTVLATMQADDAYLPKGKVYPGKITFFRAINAPKGFHDNRLGWRNLARGGFEVFDVPGTHTSMREEPRVAVLVEKLKPCLEKAQVKSQL